MRGVIFILLSLIVIFFGIYSLICISTGTRISLSSFITYCRDIWQHVALVFHGKPESRDNDYSSQPFLQSKMEDETKVSFASYVALREKYTTLAQEKEEALRQLAQQEDKWSNQLESIRLKYNQSIRDVENLSKQNAYLQKRVLDLKTVAKKLFPVAEDSVAFPFCQFFQHLERIFRSSFSSLVEVICSLDRFETSKAFNSLGSYLNVEDSLGQSQIMQWYVLLVTSSAVTAEAASDIEHKSDEEVLHYLQRIAFENYFRPKIASFLLLCEHIRLNITKEDEASVISIIEDFLLTLETYGIRVIYCRIGAIIDDINYNDIEIHVPDEFDKVSSKNMVTDVIKYGVNCQSFGCEGDQTIVEMII